MKIPAVLSMLHEASDVGSASRLFRGRPVLEWTLRRLAAAGRLSAVAVVCWDDQAAAVGPIAAGCGARVMTTGPRRAIASMDAVTVARRWADGWRGGLLQTCEFDRGFFAPFLVEAAKTLNADALVLIDSAAGLVDAGLVDGLVEHAEANATRPLIFSQAAPGLSGVVIRAALLGQLAAMNAHPGKFIHYQPSQPTRDPISELNCAPVPTTVARSTARFTLDSSRQISRLSMATSHLNGQLLHTTAAGLVEALKTVADDGPPREISVELTTRRATRPIFLPRVERPDLTPEDARRLFGQLADVDDLRLTLGGVGDALLAEHFFEIVGEATAAGIRSIHLRTDLVGVTPERIAALVDTSIDVVSIHIPAVTATTYQTVMGVDALGSAVGNIRHLLHCRAAAGRGLPIVVPVFTKCRQNLAEMEIWYDKWLAAMGSAVITGAADFAGRIEDHAVADMSPPLRRACNRIASRLHVLSDARVAPCEQDAFGEMCVGGGAEVSLADAWGGGLAMLRQDHRDGTWDKHQTCARCREWHRP